MSTTTTDIAYSIVTDSNYRRFIKEEEYGFIAEIQTVAVESRYAVELVPMNKGCDMTGFELEAAYKKAHDTYHAE